MLKTTVSRCKNGFRRIVRSARFKCKQFGGIPARLYIENRWRLGDEIMALPFYELLRRCFPRDFITLSVNYPSLVPASLGIVIDNSVGEFECDRYIFARHDQRTQSRLEHLCDRFKIPYENIEPKLALEYIGNKHLSLSGTGLVVGFSCGAGWQCKSWDVKAMRNLLGYMQHQIADIQLIEIGKDCPKVGIGKDLTDSLSIQETAEVLAACDLYIGPDSGLVHLAMAVGTETVGLFGPVKPSIAFGERKRLNPVLAPVNCQGCWTELRMETPGLCPLGIRSNKPENYPCMQSITPELVLDVITTNGLLPCLH